MSKTITIATHSGKLHADETTAIALMRIFMNLPQVEIFRTRDIDVLDTCDYQIDVGGLYAPEAGYFDHHQFDKDFSLYGKSSAGLIWDHIKNTMDLAIAYPVIDELVKDVDDQDTGIKLQEQFHFCSIVSSFNLEDVYSEEQDLAFAKAVEFVETYLESLIAKTHANYEQAHLAYNTPIKELAGIKFAITKPTEYIGTEHFIGLADMLVSWDEDQSAWTVLTVPLEKGTFGSKYTLAPANDAQEVFTHKAGFIGKYYEKKDGTIYFVINKNGEQLALSLEVQ